MRRSRLALLVLFAAIGTFSVFVPTAFGQESYAVTVTVVGLAHGLVTNVYVDGAPNGTMYGGQTTVFTFQNSAVTHIITVDFYVPNSQGENGTRYYNKETSWSFNSAGTHTFTYSPQYYLTVETSFSTATGADWYDSGASAQAAIKDALVDEGQGTREVFAGWGGDASGTGVTSNPILMSGPKKAVATWKTQFYLTVDADPPSVSNLSGAGWYDANSQASFSAPSVVPADQSSRLKFNSWSGAYAGQSATGTVTMDRPKSVTAHYVAQYLLEVQYDPLSLQARYNETHAGWYDAGTSVQLGPVPTTIDASSVERLRFVGWSDNGEQSSDVSITVRMDKPHKVLLRYITQYYLDVRSQYGDAAGSGWYDQGSTAIISVSSTSGTWPVSYSLTDWRVDPSSGKLTGADDSWSIIVDRPYVVEAVWSVDYLPLVALFGGGGLLVAVAAAGIVVGRKRGLFKLPAKPRLRSRAFAIQGRVCSNCGARLPEGATFCQQCGTPTPSLPLRPAGPSSLEDRVYDYIVKHEGVISMSKAAKDLGITVEQLKDATGKLKDAGRLA